MVYYSQQAEMDLDDIVVGMLQWEKHELNFEHVMSYRYELKNACDALDAAVYHFSTQYPDHSQYGKFVYAYKRNQRTTWYVIYDIDKEQNIYIQKIISNYLTIN